MTIEVIAFSVWVLLISNAKRIFKNLEKRLTTKNFIISELIYMILIITTTIMWGKVK